MINFNMKEDIFDSCVLFGDDIKNLIIDNLKGHPFDTSFEYFREMEKLYLYLKEYEQLCSDYKKCSGDFSKSLIEKRLNELQKIIKEYYVVDVVNLIKMVDVIDLIKNEGNNNE